MTEQLVRISFTISYTVPASHVNEAKTLIDEDIQALVKQGISIPDLCEVEDAPDSNWDEVHSLFIDDEQGK
jgi:hypothetical protein